MEHLTLWGLCGLLISNIDSLFVRESSVGILLNIFYPLTRRMPLLKMTSACRIKLKVGIFDLIWPNFGALRWGFWLKILLKSQMLHICPGSPPLGLNINRCIRTKLTSTAWGIACFCKQITRTLWVKLKIQGLYIFTTFQDFLLYEFINAPLSWEKVSNYNYFQHVRYKGKLMIPKYPG